MINMLVLIDLLLLLLVVVLVVIVSDAVEYEKVKVMVW